MPATLPFLRLSILASATLVATIAAPTAHAGAPDPGVVQNPSVQPRRAVVEIDLSDPASARAAKVGPYPKAAATFDTLDAFILPHDPNPVGARTQHALPPGLSQVGGMVVPDAMLQGADMVPDVAAALLPGGNPSHGGAPELCMFPDEAPSGIYDDEYRPGNELPRHATVFLNFNGADLSTGAENSAEDQSNLALTGHPFPVYGGGQQKAIAVAQAVQGDFADWAVRVVYEKRPPKVLPYVMVMMGGHYSDTTSGPSGGVAPLDCEDYGQRNVCYAFQNGQPAAAQANVASQEIGHTMGLGHTQASDSVMAFGYAATQAGDLGFNDACTSTVAVSGQGAACVGVNKCHCGDSFAQHDKRTLGTTFAPAGPDITPPTIALLSPQDGAEFESGETVNIELDPSDDVGGYGWQFTVTNLDTDEVIVDQVDYLRELLFNLAGLPDGNYEIAALVQDHADQTGEDVVTFSVGLAAADDGLDGASDGGDAGSDDGTAGGQDGPDAGAADDNDDDDATDGTAGGDDAGLDGGDAGVGATDEACSCTTETPSGAGLLVLGLLGLIRRRR